MELFCITTKNGRYPRVFTLSSWYENALNTIDKRNIHDIEEPAEKKICQKVWKWNQETKYFIVLFLLLFINYSLVQVTIRIITCSWIISTLWWTKVSWKCPVSLLCVRFKVWQQRLKRPPWLEENADVQLSAVCYTHIYSTFSVCMTYSFRYLNYIIYCISPLSFLYIGSSNTLVWRNSLFRNSI